MTIILMILAVAVALRLFQLALRASGLKVPAALSTINGGLGRANVMTAPVTFAYTASAATGAFSGHLLYSWLSS